MKRLFTPVVVLLITLPIMAQSPVKASGVNSPDSSHTFTNPLLPSGADPSVVQRDGFYYYMQTTGSNLTIWKTKDITALDRAEKRIVWTPPASGPYSKEIWAPELHFVSGKWYIYFAADAGTNESHRLWVIENAAADPTEGTWVMKGKLTDPSDTWAIDPSEFDVAGKNYVIWSGWSGDTNGVQHIYIARLKNPWTIDGNRALISSPEYPWEKVGDLSNGNQGTISIPHVDVNEGPEILQHAGRLFLIYSASGCWTNYYELGMLSASIAGDLLNPASWEKSSKPVFEESPEAGVFGPGHNTFFKSPDGREDWILYHANSAAGQGCSVERSPRTQKFTWRTDGTPEFGKPLSTSTFINKPSSMESPTH